MATASVKEALARGQYLCLCQFIREGGCIVKCLAYMACAKKKECNQDDLGSLIQNQKELTGVPGWKIFCQFLNESREKTIIT